MPSFTRAAAVLLAVLAPLALSACSDPPPLYVDGAWIRLSPNKDTPSAGYFTVHGGGVPVTLRDVITDRALKVEMHESMTQGGMASMKAIDAVDIPAGAQVAFAPGGKHLMLWNVNPTAVSQGKMPLTFLFSNGDRIIVDAVIQKTGAAAPAPEHATH
jgi:copper(I)-binding protein